MKKLVIRVLAFIAPVLMFFTGCPESIVVYYMGPVPEMKATGKIIENSTTNGLADIRAILLQDSTGIAITNYSGNDGAYFISLPSSNIETFTLNISDTNSVFSETNIALETSGNSGGSTNIDIELNRK